MLEDWEKTKIKGNNSNLLFWGFPLFQYSIIPISDLRGFNA